MWKRLSNKLLCQLKNIHSYKSCARDVSNKRFSHFQRKKKKTKPFNNSSGRFKWIHRLLQFSSIRFLSWRANKQTKSLCIHINIKYDLQLCTAIDNINFLDKWFDYIRNEYCIPLFEWSSIHIFLFGLDIHVCCTLYPKSVYHNFHVVHIEPHTLSQSWRQHRHIVQHSTA